MVIYCKSVHFNGFEDARQNLSFYEMSSFKEGKAMKLAEESGEEDVMLDSHKCFAVKIYLSSKLRYCLQYHSLVLPQIPANLFDCSEGQVYLLIV